MRYRPFGKSGPTVSAISMRLENAAGPKSANDWIKVIYAALEVGINSFEVAGHSPALIDGVAEALSHVERRLIFLAWRVGGTLKAAGRIGRDFSPQALEAEIQSVLTRTQLGYLDLALLDDPAPLELGPDSLNALQALRSRGLIRSLGLYGASHGVEDWIKSRAFDVLSTRFNLLSSSPERGLVRQAAALDMSVISFEPIPHQFPTAQAPANRPVGGLFGFGRVRSQVAADDAYGFLTRTKEWLAEDICLAYALTEPAVATLQIGAESVGRLEAIAMIPERDLPSNLPAQIEMARFGSLSHFDRRRIG
jgi:aryl-alcohol dehydrogenase-like predicted oxidoreductase